MQKVYTSLSTGLPELDDVIQGVRPGDNIVWQVNSIEDYISFVHPFCRDAVKKGNRLIYFHFADHASLIPEGVNAETYRLHPENGFESFISEIFDVIEKAGYGAFYVFDCLSDLAVDWYSDRMLANFFMLTCPYLYDYDTVTYFALLRNYHTTETISSINDTAQVIIDVYRNKDELFIQPSKVFKRYTNTIYTLHSWKDGKFLPVTSSTLISEIMSRITHTWASFTDTQQDLWNRIFTAAKEIQDKYEKSGNKPGNYEEYRQRLLRMVVTREEKFIHLAERNFTLSDLIEVGNHMVGTGLIGGKTVGMLLARAILRNKSSRFQKILEPHDSFYVGSDVFYSYLIMSKCWWVRHKQRNSENFLEGIDEVRRRMLSGSFPQDILDQFKEILSYFGQSPVIIRSSSLLEDAYGNSFSGKYESIFCANQGTPEERLEDFINAVKKVYASTMNRDALLYRSQRGLLDRDEQMALLIQRVSGSVYNQYFFPQAAGVGFSYNLYAWNKDIDPGAGVLRLVFGLGTRAVERISDDYTRIVALNEPAKRPESNTGEIRKFSQRKMDLLDLSQNRLVSEYYTDIVKDIPGLPMNLFTSRDRSPEGNDESGAFLITFDGMLGKTGFVADIRDILSVLQEAYDYPVDIEFTVNFENDGSYRINLLQCRPYQVKIGTGIIQEPENIKEEDLIFKTDGPIIGSSIHTAVDRIIYVVPAAYSRLNEQDRYDVARTVGKITNIEKERKKVIMLLGPGRWATTTPALGVPVHFGEINTVSVICEVAEMCEDVVPDISLGTHFFNDLVELDILYMAIDPGRKENYLDRDAIMAAANQLAVLLPAAAKWSDVIRVLDASRLGYKIVLNADSVKQKGICYKGKKNENQ